MRSGAPPWPLHGPSAAQCQHFHVSMPSMCSWPMSPLLARSVRRRPAIGRSGGDFCQRQTKGSLDAGAGARSCAREGSCHSHHLSGSVSMRCQAAETAQFGHRFVCSFAVGPRTASAVFHGRLAADSRQTRCRLVPGLHCQLGTAASAKAQDVNLHPGVPCSAGSAWSCRDPTDRVAHPPGAARRGERTLFSMRNAMLGTDAHLDPLRELISGHRARSPSAPGAECSGVPSGTTRSLPPDAAAQR